MFCHTSSFHIQKVLAVTSLKGSKASDEAFSKVFTTPGKAKPSLYFFPPYENVSLSESPSQEVETRNGNPRRLGELDLLTKFSKFRFHYQ